jgi:phosphoglucosamine mutase
MSNLGFHHAMKAAGITVICTPVGDRYVLEELRDRGLSLGGEQSGHVIFTDAATTGDGLLTALHLLGVVQESGRPLSELAAVVRRLPQILINVAVHDKEAVASSTEVAAAVQAAELELGDSGRILLRPSGTENLVRVMVEAETAEQASAVAERVAASVSAE